jgi:hypothetical protein
LNINAGGSFVPSAPQAKQLCEGLLVATFW